MDMIIRCLFSKPWPDVEPKVTLRVGQFSVEKVEELGPCWASVVDLKHPGLGFAASAGLVSDDKDKKDEEGKQVDLGSLRQVTRSISDGPDPGLDPKFKKGDEVTMIKRMTWSFPQPGAPNYRKDIMEGTEGVIEGWADPEQRQVLLKVVMNLPSGPKQSITKEAHTRNLKLTSEYKESKGGPAGTGGEEHTASGASSSAKDPCKCPDWALGKSEPSSVKKEPSFKSLQADSDSNLKLMYLRSRIGVSMQALAESLPSYGDQDFLVVHRKNDKGIWKDELWTKRDFDAWEIQLGPFSSQLKESHLMAAAHAVVGLPKHGRGAHPENLSLALDGRGRTSMAKKDHLDSQEHLGSLFWLVSRTSTAPEANMALENVMLEYQVKVCLPAPKRRKVVSVPWESAEMPTIPIMVNKRALKKHTQLFVYQQDKKNEDKKNGDKKKNKN